MATASLVVLSLLLYGVWEILPVPLVAFAFLLAASALLERAIDSGGGCEEDAFGNAFKSGIKWVIIIIAPFLLFVLTFPLAVIFID
jgi:hypothetical protein